MHAAGLLSSLPGLAGTTVRQISPENPDGAKGNACRAVPDPANPDTPHSAAALDLGTGWKVRPFIRVQARREAVLADIAGPGTIAQFWIATDAPQLRALVLRIWWDDEPHPSVEVPLGDFFCIGHDAERNTVTSLPIVVAPRGGMNCYWQMPFRRRARVALENQGASDVNVVAYKILWREEAIADDVAYFHAQWRRSLTTRAQPQHVILDGVRGEGCYVGTYLAWSALSRGWWGEGEVKFWLDGDAERPSLCDTGTEDYFGGAWCFDQAQNGREAAYSTPFLGMPCVRIDGHGGPRLFGLYRWHLQDAIGFREDLRVAVQALGWWPGGRYEPLTDDIASVAYWYQRVPHAPFPPLPPLSERWGR